ncbi:MAG: SDR family NAD(P)-dependent oxidoreductase [Sphingobium sp.]|uniref:SDR family NAD(P)-dependent oxidoreductase n=1 Tax=Sphingobium sp. TaxID=1912891 RepID=UPI0029B8A01F|nr:SDR family NAD(P)-dependent oxidoreductase [Sphingobium sp.]MDX3911090.1 SDR family NAD(P)-dependent oxidoreductase [Sphingobium sp.]
MSIDDPRPVLVTGGAGFIGCNLADRLSSEGHDVLVLDALRRPGVQRNLDWLLDRHSGRIHVTVGDVRDDTVVSGLVRQAGAVFHMAAQVAVTTSMTDPREDFEINLRGTMNVLEAARQSGSRPPVIFASTNKVYGDLGDVPLALTNGAYQPTDSAIKAHGIGEARPLDFHTPYGCSKGGADQYVLDYARSYDLPTAVLRMSCIYGERQMGTEDQGWVAHFLIQALEGAPITLYGDGHQVRDILNVSDAVDAYMGIWKNIERLSGRAYNLGGGPDNAVSLRQLLGHVEDVLDAPLDVRFSDWRAGDQRYFVADRRAIDEAIGLRSPIPWKQGVAALLQWLQTERAGSHAPVTVQA